MKSKKAPGSVRVWCAVPGAVYAGALALMLASDFSIWLAIGGMPEFTRFFAATVTSQLLSLVALKYLARIFIAVELSPLGIRRSGAMSAPQTTPWRQIKSVTWRKRGIHFLPARLATAKSSELELSPWINDLPGVRKFLAARGLPAPSTRLSVYERLRQRTGLLYAVLTLVPLAALLFYSNSKKNEQFALAAFTGHTAAIKFWLLTGLDPNVPIIRANALIVAAMSGQVATVELLLQNGAKVNLPSIDGITPLQIAAAKSSVETVRMLLLYGADPRARLPDGRPLYRAVKDAGDRKIASLLTKAMQKHLD